MATKHVGIIRQHVRKILTVKELEQLSDREGRPRSGDSALRPAIRRCLVLHWHRATTWELQHLFPRTVAKGSLLLPLFLPRTLDGDERADDRGV